MNKITGGKVAQDEERSFTADDYDLLFMDDDFPTMDMKSNPTPRPKPVQKVKIDEPLLITETDKETESSSLPAVVRGDEVEFKEKDTNKFGILPGDILHINVWKEAEMDREVLVLPDGTITFPLVGTVDAYGLSPSELQDEIIDRLATKIPDAAVTVSMVSLNGHKITVIGQVVTPGEYIMTTDMGVMQALSQAGGLTPFADEGDIIVIRKQSDGTKDKIKYPYNAISNGKKLDKDIDLKPGDVVIVPTAGLF